MYSALRSTWHLACTKLILSLSKDNINIIFFACADECCQLSTTHKQQMDRLTEHNRAERKQSCLSLSLKSGASLSEMDTVNVQPRSSRIPGTLYVAHPWLICATQVTLLHRWLSGIGMASSELAESKEYLRIYFPPTTFTYHPHTYTHCFLLCDWPVQGCESPAPLL